MIPVLILCVLGALRQDPPGDDEGFRWASGPRVAVAYQGADSIRAVRIGEFLRGLPPLPALPDTLPSGCLLYTSDAADDLA